MSIWFIRGLCCSYVLIISWPLFIHFPHADSISLSLVMFFFFASAITEHPPPPPQGESLFLPWTQTWANPNKILMTRCIKTWNNSFFCCFLRTSLPPPPPPHLPIILFTPAHANTSLWKFSSLLSPPFFLSFFLFASPSWRQTILSLAAVVWLYYVVGLRSRVGFNEIWG